ncbi:MAG: NAD(+)/NADH kinase [Pirellulales bacterium]
MIERMTSPAANSCRKPRVIVLGAGQKPSIADGAERLRGVVEEHCEIVVWDLQFEVDLSEIDAEYVVVFGGDGSILRAVHKLGYRQRPIVGVNLGKLGFLADVARDELPALLPKLCRRELVIGRHVMLECTLVREGVDQWTELALNEAAVLGGPPFVILDVELYVDAQWVTTYSADGLIISTPVGSTAHSLSAGGPILRKDLSAVVISPISPHALTMRPVVDSAERKYELVIPSPNEGTHMVVDGRDMGVVLPGDRFRVSRAEPCCLLVEAPGHSYYGTLRDKLGWSGRFMPNNR